MPGLNSTFNLCYQLCQNSDCRQDYVCWGIFGSATPEAASLGLYDTAGGYACSTTGANTGFCCRPGANGTPECYGIL